MGLHTTSHDLIEIFANQIAEQLKHPKYEIQVTHQKPPRRSRSLIIIKLKAQNFEYKILQIDLSSYIDLFHYIESYHIAYAYDNPQDLDALYAKARYELDRYASQHWDSRAALERLAKKINKNYKAKRACSRL